MEIGYYPGCSGDGSGIEYKQSTVRTAGMFGYELKTLEDWNCCGATSAHNTSKLLALALPARNLAIAEKMGLDTVLAPCAACYSRHRSCEINVRENEENRRKITEAIAMEIKGETTTISVLEWLRDSIGIDTIKEKVVKPLKGMKAACYYGCLLVRPVSHTGFDDAEHPQSMDKIIEALGAKAVDWSYKTECCGAALATSRPEIGAKMIRDVLENAREAGAECIVTVCPLCMLNLDMRQGGAKKAYGLEYDMPIYYITELVAIAGGHSPAAIGVQRHFVEAMKYLASLPDKAAAQEEAEASRKSKGKAEASGADQASTEEQQKKIAAMLKGLQKNPEKMALKIIENEERAGVLAEIMKQDEKKLVKIAELMVADKEKATKAAEAYVSGELKKRGK